MAQRWSFIEDYIIGKFCEENEHEDIRDDLLDELVDRLTEAGFDSRCRVTVQRRAREFTYLFRGWDSPYTTEQINKVTSFSICILKYLRQKINGTRVTTKMHNSFL